MSGRETPTGYFWGGQVYGQPDPATGNDLTSVSAPQNGFDMDGSTVLTRHNQPGGAYVGAFHSGNTRKLLCAIGCAYSAEYPGTNISDAVWLKQGATGPWELYWPNALTYPVEGQWEVYAGCGSTPNSGTEHFLGNLWTTFGILGNGAFSYTPILNPLYCDYVVLRMPFNAAPIDGFIRDFAWYTGQVAPPGTSCYTHGTDTTGGGPGDPGGPGGCGTNY